MSRPEIPGRQRIVLAAGQEAEIVTERGAVVVRAGLHDQNGGPLDTVDVQTEAGWHLDGPRFLRIVGAPAGALPEIPAEPDDEHHEPDLDPEAQTRIDRQSAPRARKGKACLHEALDMAGYCIACGKRP